MLVSGALEKGLEGGLHSFPPMSLGLEEPLEAQQALETIIQVGPEACGHPVQGRGT